MRGRLGLPVDCVSSAMTPPATILDSGACNIMLNPRSHLVFIGKWSLV